MSALTRTVAPTVEPITIAEAMDHLRETDSTQSGYIDAIITVAREMAENHTGRQLVNATYTLKLDGFPAGEIRLPRPPLSSITSIVYEDADSASQTLSSSLYQVDTASVFGRVSPIVGESWPSTEYGAYNTVTITYVAGYGSTAASVPADIRHAIKLLISHLYEMREPVITGTIVAQIPMSAEHLLARYRVPSELP